MTRHGTEPRSSGLLANTITIMPMSGFGLLGFFFCFVLFWVFFGGGVFFGLFVWGFSLGFFISFFVFCCFGGCFFWWGGLRVDFNL